jgi:hypothetical protein
MELTCCQGLFAAYEDQLRQVDTAKMDNENFLRLEAWQRSMTQAIRVTVSIDNAKLGFFTRLMIYAKANAEPTSRYLSVYEMLYERPREASLPERPISVISTEGKVM